MAIAWVLSQPGIFCALTGPSSEEHLTENLGASGWKIEQEDLDGQEIFFRLEQEKLELRQGESLKEILSAPLSPDTQAAFVDLVYVLETAIVLGLVSQDKILPVFYKLFALRGGLGEPDAAKKLENIRIRINTKIPS